jgi:hypothetical protein
MGHLETQSKIRTRRSKINQAILTSVCVGIAGTLNPAMLVRGILKELKVPKEKRRSMTNGIYLARKRLLSRGLLEFENGRLAITEAGKLFMATEENQKQLISIPKRWDNKWRILIFDVKEERKTLREKIRLTLRAIGFTRLQDSVWVFPYDCEDFIALLKADFKVGKDLIYIIADTIENDKELRKHFSLP